MEWLRIFAQGHRAGGPQSGSKVCSVHDPVWAEWVSQDPPWPVRLGRSLRPEQGRL